jgi:hypothetical protein
MCRSLVFLSLLLLAGTSVTADSPLTVDFSDSMSGGVDSVQLFDLRRSGDDSIYAVSYSQGKAVMYVFGIMGEQGYSTTVSREGGQESGKEETQIVYVADLDDSRELDLLLGTEIQASGITDHRLIRIKRSYDDKLQKTYNRVIWMVKDTGRVTSISVADVNGDGLPEVVTSSTDGRIRGFSSDGNDVTNFSLGTNIWHVTISEETYEWDNKNMTRYLAGTSEGLFLLSSDGTAIWNRSTGTRFLRTACLDIDGDGRAEYLGLSANTVYAYNGSGDLMWEYAASDVGDIGGFAFPAQKGSNLVVADGRNLVFLDGMGREVMREDTGEKVTSVKFAIFSGSPHLIVGTRGGLMSYGVDRGYFRAQQARVDVRLAQDAIAAGDFEKAANLTMSAADIFSQMDLGGDRSEALQLNEKATTLMEADRLYGMALASYKIREYNQSAEYAKRAQAFYEAYGYLPGINRSQELARDGGRSAVTLVSAKETRDLADRYYAEAEANYINGTYGESLRMGRLAAQEYRRIGNEMEAKTAEKLVQMSESAMAESSTTIPYANPFPDATLPAPEKSNNEQIVIYSTLALLGALLVLAVLSKLRMKRPTS